MDNIEGQLCSKRLSSTELPFAGRLFHLPAQYRSTAGGTWGLSSKWTENRGKGANHNPAENLR
jgi:hypothetical protein